jgi:uncharacterized protein Yka (UPF0111/DUF47 family)
MATNLELYEVLKRTLDEDAARMIAEVIPLGTDVATKSDVQDVKADIQSLERRIDRLEADLMRRTLAFFMPLWIAVLATMIAVVVKT